MRTFKLVALVATTAIAAGIYFFSSRQKRNGKEEDDEASSSSPSAAPKTPDSLPKPKPDIKSHPLPSADSPTGRRAITLVRHSQLVRHIRPCHVLSNPSLTGFVYNKISYFLPTPLPVIRSWIFVLMCRSQMLRTATSMLAELEAMSVLTASIYLPEDAVFPVGAVLTFFRALIARYPVLYCRDLACVMHSLEGYVRRAYSRRSMAAPLLLEVPSSALVVYSKPSRSPARFSHGDSAAAGDQHRASASTSELQFDYSKNDRDLAMVLRSSINFWCFQIAKQMGFYRHASHCLNQSSHDIAPVSADITKGYSTMDPEDNLAILEFALEIDDALELWKPCMKERTLSYVVCEESLVNAVTFIVNLSAGSLPYNKKTREMLVRSCFVVTEFARDYTYALQHWDPMATTPFGMSPFYVVKDCVEDCLEKIELVKPLWFESEGLSEAVKDLKEAVLEANAALVEERKVLLKVKPQLTDADEASIDFGFSTNAGSSGPKNKGPRKFKSRSKPAPAPASASTSGGEGAAPAPGFVFGSGTPSTSASTSGESSAPAPGFVFGSSAPSTPAGTSAEGAAPASGFAFGSRAPSTSVCTSAEGAAPASGFVFGTSSASSAEAAQPAFNFSASATAAAAPGVERQGSGTTSGESTPLSESGSVFGFGAHNSTEASTAAAGASGNQQRNRRRKPKK